MWMEESHDSSVQANRSGEIANGFYHRESLRKGETVVAGGGRGSTKRQGLQGAVGWCFASVAACSGVPERPRLANHQTSDISKR